MTTLDVTLRIENFAEPLSHLTVLETDDPAFPTRDFLTFGRPQPRFHLEPAESNGALSVRQNSTVRADFTAFSYGTASEPAAPLGDSAIESSLKVEWAGDPRNRNLPEGVNAQSRQFSVILRGEGEPGERMSTVTVRHGDDMLGTTSFRWEVAQVVKAVPSALVLSTPEGVVKRVVSLQSKNENTFRVLGVSSTIPGVRGEVIEPAAKKTHEVRIAIDFAPGKASQWGRITVTTNHPAQPVTHIGIFMSSRPPGRGTSPEAP